MIIDGSHLGRNPFPRNEGGTEGAKVVPEKVKDGVMDFDRTGGEWDLGLP